MTGDRLRSCVRDKASSPLAISCPRPQACYQNSCSRVGKLGLVGLDPSPAAQLGCDAFGNTAAITGPANMRELPRGERHPPRCNRA